MKAARIARIVVPLLLSLLTTGCWDRTELNDRALVMASGLDITNDDKLLLTDQIVLPANLSQAGNLPRQNFLTLSATGRDILDAGQALQTKLSRKYFLGHRRIIFIGEEVAKHGMSGMMDEYTRNPDVRLRSDMFVVKGDTAAHALQVTAPLEQYPALAIIKSRQFVGGVIGTTLLSFLMASASDTSCPTLPVLEIVTETEESDKKTFQFAGRAIFNKQLKLVGYLDYSGANYRLWVINTITRRQVTFYVPEGQGYATIDFSQLKGDIRSIVKNGDLQYVVTLKGQGILRETEADINVKKPKQVKLLETRAEEEVVQKVTRLISMVQQDYGTDIFGFDLAMARQHPRQWQTLKSKWEAIFPHVPVKVIVHIKVRAVGLTSEKPVSSESSKENWSW